MTVNEDDDEWLVRTDDRGRCLLGRRCANMLYLVRAEGDLIIMEPAKIVRKKDLP